MPTIDLTRLVPSTSPASSATSSRCRATSGPSPTPSGQTLAGHDHLELIRDGDAIVARTDLGRAKRVVIAGHIDTVPLNDNLPTRFETDATASSTSGAAAPST